VTRLEFAYSTSPEHLKAFLMACSLAFPCQPEWNVRGAKRIWREFQNLVADAVIARASYLVLMAKIFIDQYLSFVLDRD
jgi:hypothetical protein